MSLVPVAARSRYVLAAPMPHKEAIPRRKEAMSETRETSVPDTLINLRARLAEFAAQRDWD